MFLFDRAKEKKNKEKKSAINDKNRTNLLLRFFIGRMRDTKGEGNNRAETLRLSAAK